MLRLSSPDGVDVPTSYLVFGIGTIGRQIVAHLRPRAPRVDATVLPWNRPSELHQRLEALAASTVAGGPERVCVIWAAGAAGFSATTGDVDRELATFTQVLDASATLRRSLPSARFDLHLVSSAGAWHTLQAASAAAGAQYAELKQRQEELAHRFGADATHIHRPSSVIGVPGLGRPGLVGTLILNGMRHRITPVSAGLDTMRDFVTSRDVGAAIAHHAAEVTSTSGAHFLISAQPTPISRVLDLVQRTIRRAVRIQIVESWNARDIVYPAALRSPTFVPTDLRSAIAWAHRQALSGCQG